MTTLLAPVARQLFLNPSTGAPASGYKLFTYAAGTPTTKQNTYIDSTGDAPNSNPIILDSLGEADVWLTSGLGYKFVFAPPTDTDPPSNPIWTVDNIFGSPLTGTVSPWAMASGLPNAITADYDPTITSLPDGLLLGVRFIAANTTSTPTFHPDSQPAYVITEGGGQPLAIGAIAGPNFEGLLRFNLPFTRWELLNPAASSQSGSVTVEPAFNASMVLTTAGTTATFNAELVTVATALNGVSYTLSSYSQSLNVGTTGPGGMDSGGAPVSSYVCIYAIYNPTTTTSSIMACDIATSDGTIYSGSNLPAGFTASALIGVWPTDSSGNLYAAVLSGRHVAIQSAAGATTNNPNWTALVLTAGPNGIPKNAVAVDGTVETGTATASYSFRVASYRGVGNTDPGVGEIQFSMATSTGTFSFMYAFSNLPIVTPSTIYFRTSGSGAIGITGYWF